MNSLETIFWTVADMSWRSSCLILAVFALRAVLRGRIPAYLIFWAWIVVSIRLLAPGAFPTPWSPLKLSLHERHAHPAIGRGAETPGALPVPNVTTWPASSQLNVQTKEGASSWKQLTPGQWTALIWGAGVAALLLGRIFAEFRFFRALRRSQPAAARLSEIVSGLAGWERIEVRITDAVSAPALHGIFRPQLLFPPEFLEKLTPHELRLILAHELAHDRRRDLLAQVLIHTAVIVHWFNPLMWIMARVARDDCELACDEFVLRRLSSTGREAYGTTLLKIVTLASCGTPPPLGLGIVESKQQLKRRIQMIVDRPSPTLVRTVLGCALFLLFTGISLTRESLAQPPAAPSGTAIIHRPEVDGLDALFPNGIVATVGDKVIKVEDVRREMKQFIPSLEKEARDQADFNVRFTRLQNRSIRDLIDRFLLVKEFNQHRETTGEKHIPSEYIDNAIADLLKDQFDNDRAKFLAYLQSRGVTFSQYRREVEDDIIFHYMKSQERKLDAPAKPAKQGEQAHLRLIQLKRAQGETDAQLLDKATVILARLRAGETFDALAREFSDDARRNRGGDWGWQRPEDLRAAYRDTVFAMKPGEVSAPIFAPEGCFLLFVEDRK